MTEGPTLRLSVIIPTKDRPLLLAAAVQSVLDALPDEAELLVVDDRSTPPVAESLTLHDPRLRIMASSATPGASGARNWGVAQARGGRILFLDDDDLMLPGYPAWVLHQEADYGFAPTLVFSGIESPALAAFAGGIGQPVAGIRPFRHQVAGLGCGFWIDRAVFQASGGIAEDIRVNEDTEFSVRLLGAGLRGLRAPFPAVMVRKHGGGAGQRGHLTTAAKSAERAGYFRLILDRHAGWLASRPDAARHLLQRQLKMLAKAGDGAGAKVALRSPLAKGHRFSLQLYYAAEVLIARIRGR